MAPALASIFSAAPSATGRVKKATSGLLAGPDLMMNMHICDSINADPWQANAFVKSVKKRLQNKNSRVQLLALTLLETMVKNCGDFVHFQVVDHGILQEMVKIVRRTRNMQVREKILELLQYWQEAFGGADGKYPQFYYTYAELKRSGVRFPPMQRSDEPVVSSVMPMINNPHVGYGMPNNSIRRLNEVMASETGDTSVLDLQNVRSVVELLMNMLQAVNPQDIMDSKEEVVMDLANQCCINQRKLLQLINSTDNDHILGEALTLYDNLRSAIAKYEALASGTPPPPGSSASSPVPAAVHLADDKEEEEDDGFSALAARHSAPKPTLPNLVDISTAPSVVASASEGSSSSENSALVLFDPSVTENASEAMIDLLDLAPSTNQSPRNPFSNSPSFENLLNTRHPAAPATPAAANYPQAFSYVAPWAQPVVAQSWTTAANPFLAVRYAEPQPTTTSLGPAVVAAPVRESQPSSAISSSVAPKPYMPDKLFDGLIELRNPDGSLKSRNASSLLSFKATRNEKL